MTNEDRWNLEYNKLREDKQFEPAMSRMKLCIYEYDGYLDGNGFRMPSNETAYLHVNDLISFSEVSRNMINTTEKGKYFLRKYIGGT